MSDLEDLVSAFGRLYLDLMRTLDRRMAEQGMSLARTKMLICLQRRGPMRGTAIADFFNQSPRTVTEAIDGLERDGFLQREPDPADRRAKLIRITPKGEGAVKKTEPLRMQMIEQTFGVLNEEERTAMREAIAKVDLAVASLRDAPARP